MILENMTAHMQHSYRYNAHAKEKNNMRYVEKSYQVIADKEFAREIDAILSNIERELER